MRTITIDIINEKVVYLLRNLERMNLIRFKKLKPEEKEVVNHLVDYKGKMTKQPLSDIQKQLQELRGGWE